MPSRGVCKMCRNAKFCTELGVNPDQWSKSTPLPPPNFFRDSLNYFIVSLQQIANGEQEAALFSLEKTRSNDLRQWFVEHGQMSGWHHRVKILNLPKPSKYQGNLEANKSIKPFESEVFLRDGYVCQYCNLRVIDFKVLKKAEKYFGNEHFVASGKSNQIRHGISLVFRATADHVLPMSYGGRTNLDNLVTCCWSCNYGKYNALLEQMGLDDPRNRKINPSQKWDGAISLI